MEAMPCGQFLLDACGGGIKPWEFLFLFAEGVNQ
jgi:hypothetical protein